LCIGFNGRKLTRIRLSKNVELVGLVFRKECEKLDHKLVEVVSGLFLGGGKAFVVGKAKTCK
jgi:hypothetical protein